MNALEVIAITLLFVGAALAPVVSVGIVKRVRGAVRKLANDQAERDCVTLLSPEAKRANRAIVRKWWKEREAQMKRDEAIEKARAIWNARAPKSDEAQIECLVDMLAALGAIDLSSKRPEPGDVEWMTRDQILARAAEARHDRFACATAYSGEGGKGRMRDPEPFLRQGPAANPDNVLLEASMALEGMVVPLNADGALPPDAAKAIILRLVGKGFRVTRA